MELILPKHDDRILDVRGVQLLSRVQIFCQMFVHHPGDMPKMGPLLKSLVIPHLVLYFSVAYKLDIIARVTENI